MKHLTIPNFITVLRIVGAFCLLFTEPFTREFFIVYTASGISDVLDGFIARITNKVTKFGAKLDSASDLIFYAVMAITIFPALIETLPYGIWYAVAGVVLVRIITYLFVAVKYKRFASLHTRLNKVTGLAVFLIPYMLKLKYGVAYCITACSISAVSSVHEMIVHMTSKQYAGK